MYTLTVDLVYTFPRKASRFSIGRAAALAFGALAVGCGSGTATTDPRQTTLTLAAYSAPREVLENEIVPAFVREYEQKTGVHVRVQASYLASGAQTRAVLGGFAADVVLLAMPRDVNKLADAGIVERTWQEAPHRGNVAASVVAFAVRSGNPKHIADWSDLARPGVGVLLPNPKTSGGAMWNVSAMWGAALRGDAGVASNNEAEAGAFLTAVLKNVVVLDKGARESLITFEKGIGDVAITYESEIAAGKLAGRVYDAVLPSSTIFVEIPAAIATANAKAHGVFPIAEAFLSALRSPAAQKSFAAYGFRSPDGALPNGGDTAPNRTRSTVLFRIDDLGGWQKVESRLFGSGGEFEKIWEAVYAGK
ncbi:MAG: sulfate ABC transporter substrate-binding protein [Polyangiaceae bacterium]|nr:sulfate ABC transporter substrate-binding protein [Polyangiaceae bacterium]